jgi:16S rRNA (adenine1518-N6/adenine1519-N6)-dimethyltransferase
MSGDPLRVPRSKEEVRATLAALGLRPHKRFGQNFLADEAVLDRIVERSGAGAGTAVLEVGPGLGCLTARLLRTGATVVAAEIDHGLARRLREVFAGVPRFTLVEGDVLGAGRRISGDVVLALRRACGSSWPAFDVVANLPYGISSPFLGSLVAAPGPPRRATLLLQQEFAETLVARPSTDAYSALSVFARTVFDVKRAFRVPRGAFHPVPDVESAVVTLVPRESGGVDAVAFGAFTQRLFQGRRKAIGTTLKAMAGARSAIDGVLEAAGIGRLDRVDALPPERILALFKVFGGG